ncbi:TPA: hypothetical protein SHW33_002056 [Clostridioides difficile]|uniref:KAP family P-loop NTPase fold protein n=1 Tax=Clostridioides difficile TaxID=1496 RepID=UPI001C1B75F0|nr:P-loop NTPase fold protein [Clostridioides difficile]EGT4214458.1 hypothetical protein [Clostridioides difficile]HBF3748464.1 hypothetical protein [Clostridioides difficile]HBF4652709.1 hypothetical protein [Clostridioides difficile]HBF5067104.1 hypothetical protein [Clostridioides difficile]HBF6159147.1 hypothetical protein [Clostridioides difficile]
MGLFNNKIKINEENPFEHDKLWRKSEIESLTNLFELVDNQMVLAINSPWGTGKTTFLRIWESFLKSNDELKSKYEVIYFNAWENDDCLDPLITIIGEMEKSIKEVNETTWDNIKSKGKKLVKKVAPVVIKVATAGAVTSDDLHLGDKVQDAIIDVSGNLFNVDNYVEQKQIRKDFEEELKKYQKNLGKTVVFFIDELDRCRPTFAIETLERVKHLFNLENFIFVLGIDKESLSNSIKVIYGNGTDINGYLARFIDIEYNLQDVYRRLFIEYLLDKYTFEKINFGTCNNAKSVIYDIIELFKLSLRDTEKIIITLYLISRANKNSYTVTETYIVPFLLILNKINKPLYNKVKNKDINVRGLMNALNLDERMDVDNWINESTTVLTIKANLINLLYDVEAYNELLEKYQEFERIREERATLESNRYGFCLGSCYNLNSGLEKEKLEEQLYNITRLIDIYANIEITQ